jgi:hypothetical protein
MCLRLSGWVGREVQQWKGHHKADFWLSGAVFHAATLELLCVADFACLVAMLFLFIVGLSLVGWLG